LLASAPYDHHDTCKTYEDINNSLKPVYTAKDLIYHVEVKGSNQAPIEGTNNHERSTNFVRNTSFPHREKLKN